MKLWNWLKTAIHNLPRTRRDDPAAVRYYFVPSRHAGVHVDHDTALKFSAYFCAISYIAQTIAWLPWTVIRERNDKKAKLTDHPVTQLLHRRPNPEMSAVAFRETMLAWALNWGNGYAEIYRDPAGRPTALYPIAPDRVEVKRDRETGELVYEVSNSFGETSHIKPGNMFHLHGLGFDGLVGYSVASLAARTIGLSLAAETVGEDLFANGLITNGYLSHPSTLSQAARKRMQDGLKEEASGAGRRFNPLVFEEGLEWKSLSMPLEDAQMLATREFQIDDIARWFHLPPHKLAKLVKTSYASQEMASTEVVNDAFMPWVVRLEQEANYKLFLRAERGLSTKINVTALLRGDNKSRGEFYREMRNIGVFSTNDILRLEDMDPVGPEGDALIVQSQYATLEAVVEGLAFKPAPAPEAEQLRQARAALLPLFEEAERRILAREFGQFNQVKRRFQAEEGAFQRWMAASFFPKHQDYMAAALRPPAESLVALVRPGSLNGNLEEVLQAHIEAHIEASKAAFEDLRWSEDDAYNEKNRAKAEAKALVERLMAAIVLQGAQP